MSAATGILEAVPLNPAGLRPIVGRDQDLDRLISAAGIPPPGGPQTLGGLVGLSGDAGMGKTRLIAELAERAGDHGWRVVVGHCLGEAGSTLPYLPFVELLGRLLSDEPEVADDLIAAHPSLGPLLQAHLRGPSPETSESHRGDPLASPHAGPAHRPRAPCGQSAAAGGDRGRALGRPVLPRAVESPADPGFPRPRLAGDLL